MNNWLSHVAEFRKANPDVKYKQALSEAKKTYKQTPAPVPIAPEPLTENFKAVLKKRVKKSLKEMKQ